MTPEELQEKLIQLEETNKTLLSKQAELDQKNKELMENNEKLIAHNNKLFTRITTNALPEEKELTLEEQEQKAIGEIRELIKKRR